ncbi:MAG: hypothetical protein HY820_25360 [Acidobacteria bacterium]|nr:hypothetical protein [Acidobacteriota bacterium]
MERHRGWRVRHHGRDALLYEECIDGKWIGVPIDGEMLINGHAVKFPSRETWDRDYPGFRGRRAMVIERVRSEFTSKRYQFEDE